MNGKALLMTLGAAWVLAAAPWEVTATVPFPFAFHGKPMPAGEYRIRRASHPSVYFVTHTDGRMFLFAAEPTAGVTVARCYLRFQKAGSRYVLTGLIDQATGAVMPLPVSGAAKEMAAQAETVTIAAKSAE